MPKISWLTGNTVLLAGSASAIALLFLFFSAHQTKNEDLSVLLITIDALRPDHLGCYGYKRNTSPNIDRVAKEGALFTQAISTVAQTIPSLTSIATSTYLSTNGIFSNDMALDEPVFSLPNILRNNGYYTGFISGRGFLGNFLKGAFNASENYDIPANQITAKAIEWISENNGQPFFLWLHYRDPHAPYRPPEPYKSKYLNDNIYRQNKQVPIALSQTYFPFCKNTIPAHAAQAAIKDIDYYISQYDGAISFTDEQIGILLRKLDGLGLAKRTLIVITADHGEYLGEHNFYFAHGGLYDAVLKVPLIFKCPGRIPEGRIIQQQVSSVDITPTILKLLKIRSNRKMEGENLFLGFDKWRNRRFAFSEFMHIRGISMKSIRTDQWKLIYDLINSEYRLYDLKRDPEESVDLARVRISILKSLKHKLEKWMGRETPDKPFTVVTADEQTKNRLKSLGYIE